MYWPIWIDEAKPRTDKSKNMLTEEIKNEISHEAGQAPAKSGACIDALRIVQRAHKWVSDEHVRDIAKILQMTPAEVDSVATFYNLILRKPVGRHVIRICSSVSCYIMGYETLRDRLCARLGINEGETTPDGRFTLIPNQCLGNCDHAPSFMIDNDLHQDLEPEKIEEILRKYD
jgi:NADH-quinone oxidoreductase subunit E